MAFKIKMDEGSTTSSIPTDVNVAWHGKMKERIRGKNLSVYDKGSFVECPKVSDMEDCLDNLYKMKKRCLEVKQIRPETSNNIDGLVSILDSCIEDCINDESFNFEITYSSLGNILKNLEEEVRGSIREEEKGLKGVFSSMTSSHVCPYCGSSMPQYPGMYDGKCPNCHQDIKPVYDCKESILIKASGKKVNPREYEPFILNIREEVKKRDALSKNLSRMAEGKCDRLTALKAALSCLTRVVVEEENHVGKGILSAIGEPLLVDIVSLFVNEGSDSVQRRIGKYFLGLMENSPKGASDGKPKE